MSVILQASDSQAGISRAEEALTAKSWSSLVKLHLWYSLQSPAWGSEDSLRPIGKQQYINVVQS